MILMVFLFAPTVPSAPELTGCGALRSGVRRGFDLQRQTGHVVVNADGKAVFRLRGGQVVIHCDDVRGRRILRAEAVPAADDRHILVLAALEGGHDVEIERLAERARLLGAVEHRNLLDRLRQRSNQMLRRERTVETDLDEADLLTLRGQVVDDLLGGVADRAHRDDDLLRVARAVVVEELVLLAGELVYLAHVLLDEGRHRVVVAVAGLARLEEDIRVLRRAAQHRMLRVQRPLAERLHSVHIEHACQLLVRPALDLLDLVRGAETVKEVQEGHSALDRGQMRDRAQVHDLLRVGGGEHRKTGLTAGHHVGVVAED